MTASVASASTLVGILNVFVFQKVSMIGGPAQFLEKFKNQPKITKLSIIVDLAV